MLHYYEQASKILEYSNYCSNLFSILTVSFHSLIFRKQRHTVRAHFCKFANRCTHLVRQLWQTINVFKKLSRERESQPRAELEEQLGQKLSCKPCLTEKKWGDMLAGRCIVTDISFICHNHMKAYLTWEHTFTILEFGLEGREKRRGVNNMGLCVSTRTHVITEFLDMKS